MADFGKAVKTLTKLWPALESGDPKAVHEARKLTRKAQAQLRISDSPKRTKRAWRDLRRAVAPVRDRDATGQHLMQALNDLDVPPAVREQFEQQWAAARQSRFAQVKLPEMPPPIKRSKHWKARVQEAIESDADELAREAGQVLESGPVEPWHEWRKHLKRYRYTLELTGDAPESLLQVLDQLGRMQDAQVAQELLAHEEWLPQYRDVLMKREAEAQRAAQARVRELWPALSEHLKNTGKNARQ